MWGVYEPISQAMGRLSSDRWLTVNRRQNMVMDPLSGHHVRDQPLAGTDKLLFPEAADRAN